MSFVVEQHGSCTDFPPRCISQQHSVSSWHSLSVYFSTKKHFLPSAAAIILIWSLDASDYARLTWGKGSAACVTLSVWSGALAGVNALYVSWQTQQPLLRLRGLKTCRHTFGFTLPAWKSLCLGDKNSIANLGDKECVAVCNKLHIFIMGLLFSLASKCVSQASILMITPSFMALCEIVILQVDFRQWNTPKPKGY